MVVRVQTSLVLLKRDKYKYICKSSMSKVFSTLNSQTKIYELIPKHNHIPATIIKLSYIKYLSLLVHFFKPFMLQFLLMVKIGFTDRRNTLFWCVYLWYKFNDHVQESYIYIYILPYTISFTFLAPYNIR